jgi:transcriptional regulator with XRE-family HTH domain
MTQEDLATSALVSVQMVRRLEAATANPTLGTLHAVTAALDVAWTDLLMEIEI